jgi:hypothetical protein
MPPESERSRPLPEGRPSEHSTDVESTIPSSGPDRKLRHLSDVLTQHDVERAIARRVVVTLYNEGWDFIEPFSDEDLEFIRSLEAMTYPPFSASVEQVFGEEVGT